MSDHAGRGHAQSVSPVAVTARAGLPSVSVVICAYNAEQYLRDAVESILNQTYTDLELIIIDDGSTDATPELAREFARRDRRVRSITLVHNEGIAHARQEGLDAARHDWIMYLDADDAARSQLLTRLVSAASADEDIVGVGCHAYYVGPDFRLDPATGQPSEKPFGINRVGPSDRADFARKIREGKVITLLSPTMFSVGEARKVGGYRLDGFPERNDVRWRDFGEDVDLLCRIADASADGRYMTTVPEPLFYLRKRRGSLTTMSVLASTQKYAWIKDCAIRRRQGLPTRSFTEFGASLSKWRRFQLFRRGYGALLYQRAGFAFAVDNRRVWGVTLACSAALLSPRFVLKRVRANSLSSSSLW